MSGTAAVAVLLWLTAVPAAGQGPVAVGPSAAATYTPPRTPWGDPDLQGSFTNNDENGIPLERPDDLKASRLEEVSPEELARLREEREEQRVERAPLLGVLPGSNPVHWFEHFGAKNSRAWLLVDPPDGKVPPMTSEAQARPRVRGGSSFGNGPFNSTLDFSLYDRCITRGVPGSMMPGIYGNAYEIVQTPDSVAIRYEMIHETRIIPLDGRPRLGDAVRQYMGDARGHWDGNTLVVETTNFTDKTHFGYNNQYNSEKYKLTERFTPIAPNRLQWQVTLDDPDVWTRPWSFTMPLTRNDSEPIFEYACHEGNLGLEHILSAARAEEQAARGR